MGRTRKIRELILCAAFVPVLLMVGAPSASAATGGVEFSLDGVSWSASLPGPIFSGTTVLVPGGSDSATIRVRNASAFPTLLRVDVTHIVTTGAELSHALSFGAVAASGTVAAGRRANPAVSLDTTAVCSVLLDDVLLAPGAAIPITFTIAMTDAGGMLAQGESASADLLVSLREVAAPRLSPGSCPAETSTVPLVQGGFALASTGATPPNRAIALGTALVGVGAWFLVQAIRRRRPAREV